MKHTHVCKPAYGTLFGDISTKNHKRERADGVGYLNTADKFNESKQGKQAMNTRFLGG